MSAIDHLARDAGKKKRSVETKAVDQAFYHEVEGTVLAQFVVDTTGRADVSTFTALRSDNALFTSAVRAALGRMRFLPAEVGGRKVPQLVQQPFQFTVTR